MRKDETGKECPETLGEYRDLCAAIGGDNCRAVKLLDEKIAEFGREEQAAFEDGKMRAILMPMLVE